MIIKLLLIGLAAWLAWRFIGTLLRLGRQNSSDQAEGFGRNRTSSGPELVEDMVPCPNCGVWYSRASAHVCSGARRQG